MKTLKVTAQDIVPEFIQLAKRGKNKLVMGTTIQAIEKISTMYQEAWMRAASGGFLPGLPFIVNSKQYHRTIERRQISPTSWEVYTSYTTKSGLSVTELLEKGHGPIDLKEGLLNGPKSRMGKNGRYNIVSFRHGTPGTDPYRNNPMPISVYKAFSTQVKIMDEKKAAGASPISGHSYQSKSSAAIGGREYAWGAKFDQASTRGIQRKTITKGGKEIGTYTHKTGKYAGMVSLQAATQGSKSSKYMTFRVVSAASDPMSWIVPEQPPWPIRKAVTDFMRPYAEEILQKALEQDIK